MYLYVYSQYNVSHGPTNCVADFSLTLISLHLKITVKKIRLSDCARTEKKLNLQTKNYQNIPFRNLNIIKMKRL